MSWDQCIHVFLCILDLVSIWVRSLIPHFEYEMCLSNIFSAPHLLLVEVGGRGNVCAGAGGGGEAGGVVHDGVGHVVVASRVPALLVLLAGHRGHLGPGEPWAAPGQVGHTVTTNIS